VEVTSTLAENSFFKALILLKLYTGLHYHIYSEFRHTSKNFEGGLPKNILEKTLFYEKRVSKYGRLTVYAGPGDKDSFWSRVALNVFQL
jgi:hypothetical protein